MHVVDHVFLKVVVRLVIREAPHFAPAVRAFGRGVNANEFMVLRRRGAEPAGMSDWSSSFARRFVVSTMGWQGFCRVVFGLAPAGELALPLQL